MRHYFRKNYYYLRGERLLYLTSLVMFIQTAVQTVRDVENTPKIQDASGVISAYTTSGVKSAVLVLISLLGVAIAKDIWYLVVAAQGIRFSGRKYDAPRLAAFGGAGMGMYLFNLIYQTRLMNAMGGSTTIGTALTGIFPGVFCLGACLNITDPHFKPQENMANLKRALTEIGAFTVTGGTLGYAASQVGAEKLTELVSKGLDLIGVS